MLSRGETTHYILCVALLLQNVFAVHAVRRRRIGASVLIKYFETYPQGSAQLLSEKGAYVTCFPYCFLYHSMHYENIALQDGSQF